jgi:DNA-binding GntR family transcriptional regulator
MQILADRSNLSDSLATEVRDMIVDGRLAGGERVNEVHLAARLGVSRTPLREGLMRLVSEGAVTVVPRLGFFVCPLSAEEVEQIYPMRGILDPAALRVAGLPDKARISRLKALNRRIAKARRPMEVVRLDDRWHFELVESCPNAVLLGLIEQFMWRTRRYELALMGDEVNVAGTVECHEQVIAALEAGDLDLACARLEENMRHGKGPILEWLAARGQGEGK